MGRSRPIVLFEDIAQAQALSQRRLSFQQITLQAFFQSIRGWFSYFTDTQAHFFNYETRAGARVDLAVRTEKIVCAWLFTELSRADRALIASALSFQKTYPGAKVFILGPNLKFERLSFQLYTAPLLALL